MLRYFMGGLLLLASAGAQAPSLRLLDDPFQAATYTTVPGYQQGALMNLFGVWEKAQQFQRLRGGECYDAVMIDAVAQGSFTAPKVAEKAYLYTYCQTGRQLFEQGLAVTRGNALVFNIKLTNVGGYGLTGVRDVNQNGLSELMLSWQGTGQGTSAQGITLIELSGRAYRTLLNVTTRSDNCGAVGDYSGSPLPLTQAQVVKVQPGQPPRFFADVYEGGCTAGSVQLIRRQEALK